MPIFTLKRISLFLFLLTLGIWIFIITFNPLSSDGRSCESTTGDTDCVQGFLQEVAGFGVLMLIGFLLPLISLILMLISKKVKK